MKDEIKEILEDVKRHLDYVEATKQCSIRDNEMKVMYDCITNLQEDNERLNNIINELEKDISSRIDLFEERKKDESMYGEITTKLDELYYIYGKLKELKEQNND